jgi:hypothetical protein
VHPAASPPAAHLDLHAPLVEAVVDVSVPDDPGPDLLRDHEHQRGLRSIPQHPLDRRRFQQPERDVDVVAVEPPGVVVHLPGVHHRAQPHSQLGLCDGGVVLGQQRGQGRNQPSDQDGLRHVVVGPDQDQHAVAAIGQVFQMPGTDPRVLERPLQQVVQDAPEFALGRIGALGGSFHVDRDDRAVYRAVTHRGHHRQLAHRPPSG